MGWCWVGALLVIAGLALCAVGMMMLAAAKNLGNQASQMGKQQQDAYGQQQQGQITSDNAQAKANGTSYTPPDLTDKTKNNEELHQKVEGERNATYELDGKTTK